MSVLPAAPVGSPAPGKHLDRAPSTGNPASLGEDDMAVLEWLGSVVEEDITSYEE